MASYLMAANSWIDGAIARQNLCSAEQADESSMKAEYLKVVALGFEAPRVNV